MIIIIIQIKIVLLSDGNLDLESSVEDLANSNKVKAYRIAVGKERNDVYKPTEFATNYGYEFINGDDLDSATTTRTLGEIYKVEVVLQVTNDSSRANVNAGVYTDTMSLKGGATTISTAIIPTNSTSTRTVEFLVDSAGAGVTTLTWSFNNANTDVTVKSVKVYYK